MDWVTIIAAIVSVLFMIGGGIAGSVLKGAKVAKETGDLLSVAGAALEDKTLSAEEIAAILKEYNDIKEAIAAFKQAPKVPE